MNDDLTGEMPENVSPPLAILGVAAFELILSCLAHLPGSKTMHVVGYLIGAVAVTATISAFRSVDRRRQRSGAYLIKSWLRGLPHLVLAGGLAVAMSHAWYLAMERRLA